MGLTVKKLREFLRERSLDHRVAFLNERLFIMATMHHINECGLIPYATRPVSDLVEFLERPSLTITPRIEGFANFDVVIREEGLYLLDMGQPFLAGWCAFFSSHLLRHDEFVPDWDARCEEARARYEELTKRKWEPPR
ncbi:hypothetical protein ES705_46586 [subsurface metagenome]